MTAPATRHTLRNPHGWAVEFVAYACGPDWNAVRVVRRYRGRPAGESTLTRDAARGEYAGLLRRGYRARRADF